MKLTRTIARTLDTERRLLLGRKASLILLDHDSDNGYTKTQSVPKGWMVSTESEGDAPSAGQLICEIAETAMLTADVLRETAAIGLQLAHESLPRLCKIVSRIEPVEEAFRIWKFSCTPTGETFEEP